LLYAIEASDETTKNYHYDAIGNTLALTDDTELVTDKYAYGPYGEAAGSSGATPNQFRYVGKFGVMREDNGLIFMRARFYDPTTKRFMGKDPVKGSIADSQTINPYTYVCSNPIILTDPLGTVNWRQAGLGLMQAAGGGLTIITSLGLAATGVAAPLAVAGFVVGGSVAVGGLATIADAFSDDEHFHGTPIQAVVGSAVAAVTKSEEATDTAITWTGYGETAVSLAVSGTKMAVDINKLRQAQAGVDVSRYLHQIALDKSAATAGRIGGYATAASRASMQVSKDILVTTIKNGMKAAVYFAKGKI
jgi:RHS repeat-associated protein